MADDKLKTGPEPPGPDRPGDAPAKEAPPIQEPPVQETDAPGKMQEPAASGTGPALQAEQSVISGMGEDNPARSALGEVVVDFDKINELMSQRRAAAHGAVDKLKAPATDKDGKEAPIPEEKAPEADQPKKRRGRPPKEQAAVSAEKKEKAAEPRTGRPSKVDKAAREEAPPAVRDKVSRGKKADKDKETGSGGAPASKSTKAVKPGKAAPVKEAAVPPPEIKLPPTPEVPPRPVEEGKIVYLKMAELHPFHTFREHPYKVQDDIVLIGHLNKAAGTQSTYRGLGSIDITAAVRSLLFIGKLKDSPTTRVLIHEKSSLAPPGQSLAFSLGDEKGFEWIGAYDITADELLTGTDTAKTESKTAQAEMLILELLADGKKMPSAELEKAVNDRGISSRTMRTAKSRIGDRLVTEKDGTAWVCYLRS